MSRPLFCLALLTSYILASSSECDGQIIERIRNRRAALLAPPADPNAAPPAAGPSDIGDSPPAPPLRGGFLARRLQMRRDLVAQQEALAQPTPAAPAPQQNRANQQTQRTAQRRPLDALRQASAQVAPALRALSQGEVAQLDVPELQSALSNTSGSLDNELNQFTTAASWHQFFALPSGIVDEGTIDLAALQTLLLRFENVAANPKFEQISSLPSFQQSRTLLSELVNRVDPATNDAVPPAGDLRLIDPSGDREAALESAESLPAPQPQLPRNEGEHSILVRKNS